MIGWVLCRGGESIDHLLGSRNVGVANPEAYDVGTLTPFFLDLPADLKKQVWWKLVEAMG